MWWFERNSCIFRHFICDMKKQHLPKQQSRFIPDDNPRQRGVTSFPPRSCTVSAGPGNRSWVRLTDSCRSLFPRIRGWCMRLSTSVVMRAHYICDLTALRWNIFISVSNSFCFSSGPAQLSSEWVDLEWIAYQLLAFAFQPSSPQLRGKPNKHVAILKQYNIPCSFVLFCFSEQIKFVYFFFPAQISFSLRVSAINAFLPFISTCRKTRSAIKLGESFKNAITFLT